MSIERRAVAEESTDMRRHVLEHLDELLVRARRSAIWIVLGAAIGYFTSEQSVHFMEEPVLRMGTQAPKLITTMPFEKFWVYLRVAFMTGVFAVMPIVAWEIAAFVFPGLKPIEKRRIKWLTFSIYLAFVVGLILGYLYILPAVLNAIVRFGTDRESALWTLSAYISTALGVLIVSGLFMEIPVVMVHLSSWGWVDVKVWTKGRRVALVINAIVSGILSPPDVMSMVMMMVPVQLLYESGILLARVAKWIRNDDQI